MTNRHPFQPVRASFGALAARGLVTAGLRLRLSRELTVGLVGARTALRNGTSGELLSLSFVS